MSMGTMFVNGSGRNVQFVKRIFHECFLLRFGSLGQAVSGENIFKSRPIRNKNCLWRPGLLKDRDKMITLKRKRSIDGEDFFRNRQIRNQNCLWRPCLLADQEEICYFYRRPSIDASCQVTVYLA